MFQQFTTEFSTKASPLAASFMASEEAALKQVASGSRQNGTAFTASTPVPTEESAAFKTSQALLNYQASLNSQAPLNYKAQKGRPKVSDEGYFEGYASVFNAVDHQGDALAPGAFQDTLKQWAVEGHLPKLLWQHDPRMPIGVWDHMEEDEYGLFVRGHLLLEIQKAREAYVLLKNEAIDGLSIGFLPKNGHEEGTTRVLDQVDLFEVSLVTFMANPLAHVTECKEIASDAWLWQPDYCPKSNKAAASWCHKSADAPSALLQTALSERLDHARGRLEHIKLRKKWLQHKIKRYKAAGLL